MSPSAPTALSTDSGRSAVLIYDGDCGFCERCAVFVRSRLATPVYVVAYQDCDLAEMGLTEREVSAAVFWVDGSTHRAGHDAVVRSLLACSGGWRQLGKLGSLRVIAALGRRIYPVIARHRHRLPGKSSGCAINTDWF